MKTIASNMDIKHVIAFSVIVLCCGCFGEETTNSEKELIISAVNSLPNLDGDDAAKSALEKCKSAERVWRAIAAVQLRKITNRKQQQSVFDTLRYDSDESIRRLAYLNHQWNVNEEAQFVKTVDDAFVRGIAALKSSDIDYIRQFRFDPSPFVRAVGIRRLSYLIQSSQEKMEVEVKTLLIDHDQLVRSNALLCASRIRFLPRDIGASLMMDARFLISLEEFVAPDSNAANRLIELQLPKLDSLELGFFRGDQIRSTGPELPGLDYEELVLPITEQITIGAATAQLMIQIDPDFAQKVIVEIVERKYESDELLVKQLLRIKRP